MPIGQFARSWQERKPFFLLSRRTRVDACDHRPLQDPDEMTRFAAIVPSPVCKENRFDQNCRHFGAAQNIKLQPANASVGSDSRLPIH